MNKITLADSEQEVLDCYQVMAELRPHIKRDEFVSTVKRLAKIASYQLAYLTDSGVKAVAGFRISEWPAENILRLKTSLQRAASAQKVMAASYSIG